ncbi:hypothetical protein ACOAKC_06120 [Hathewaya histolytica]|uniref:hypothetical protein n=1 Tax=Hathewaya histolytica TaxID=1498 RepID=UPI003B6829A3
MLVVEKEKIYNEDYVGNAKPLKKKEIYEELEKSRKENLKTSRKEKNKRKLSALKSVGVLFIVGMVIVVRYSVIYANQKQIANMKKEISTVKYKNDDIKVHLLKFKDIKSVDSAARGKFKMVEPSINDTYYYDLSKDNFINKEEENKGINKFLEKIKNILF